MKVTNTTDSDLGLSPRHVVPAHGEADINYRTLAALKKSPVVQEWIETGKIVIERKGK